MSGPFRKLHHVCVVVYDIDAQRRFSDAYGEDVFHLGFDVPDADAADAGSDLELLIKGRRANGSGFSYYDTAEHAGVVLQIRQSPPPEAPPA